MGSQPPFLRRGQASPRKRKGRGAGRVLLIAAALVAAGAGLTRFLGGSLFALAKFEISGNARARTEEILKALAPWKAGNLVTLDLAPVAARLQTIPWIARVTLAKKFPDGLSVRVTEREPVALLREGNGLWWLVAGEREALPEAVAVLEQLRARAPEYFSALSEISALPDGGFGMMDSIFRKPIRVLGFDAPEKIDALLKARGLIASRGWEAQAIDLRFADRIVLEGAYGAGNTL